MGGIIALLLICVPLRVFSEDHPDGGMKQGQSEWSCGHFLSLTSSTQGEINLLDAEPGVGSGGNIKRSGHSIVFPGRREIFLPLDFLYMQTIPQALKPIFIGMCQAGELSSCYSYPW